MLLSKPDILRLIDAGLDALRDLLAPLGRVHVTLPALGCGNGGLDWNRVL